MAKTISPIEVSDDSFNQWIEKTNELINSFLYTVTVSNGDGDVTIGNSFVIGVLGANTLTTSTIKGGNVSTPGSITVVSNLAINAASFTVNSTTSFISSANIQLNSNSLITAIKIAGNSTSTNVAIGGNTLLVSANARFIGEVLNLPTGNTSTRPVSPANGTFRYNTELNALEFSTANTWKYILASNGSTTNTSVLINLFVENLEVSKNLVANSIAGNGALITSVNAVSLNGQAASYYIDIPARLGYTPLNTTAYTANDVLTKIKTVDGTGSGLDADLLDGQDSAYYRNASNLNAGTIDAARMGTSTAYTFGAVQANTFTSVGNKFIVADGRSFAANSTVIGPMNSVGSAFLSYTDTAGNFTAAGNISAYSDIRLKSEIETIKNALASIKKMRGVSYNKDGVRNIGLIAQEVLEVVPEVVLSGEEYYSVMYGNLVALLIEAVKELSNRVEVLENK